MSVYNLLQLKRVCLSDKTIPKHDIERVRFGSRKKVIQD